MKRPNSLRWTVIAVILAAPGLVVAQVARTPEDLSDAREPLEVGNRRQVFIDGRFIDSAQHVELHVHQPRKTGEMNLKPERPWEVGGIGPYSSLLEFGGTYHMWYHAMDSVQWHIDKEAGAICYARSQDGIHWERPDLGLTEYKGSRQNNIVFGHGASGLQVGQDGGMVFIDPTAPDDERFRFLVAHGATGEGIHVFSSPDGLHWKLTRAGVLHARPQAHGHHLDSQNVMFWDDRISKYVCYGRKNLLRDGSPSRSIARGESATLDGFEPVQDMPVVLGPDMEDLFHGETAMVDYYMSAAIKYPWAQDAYYMFPTAYYHYMAGALGDFKDGVPTNAGPLHTQFAASRDGLHWERYERRPFVRLGMKGEFDWASTRVIHGIVPSVDGREMYMYYRGSDWLHGWDRDERNKRLLTEAGLGADQNIAVLSRVVLRRDGFISVRAAYSGGQFSTPRMIFQGRKLVLNVDTSATGIVRVGLLDVNGLPIDGFNVQECDRIHTANEVNRVVTWRGSSDLSSFAGKPISLRFLMHDADLYAFQFQD